MTLADIRIAFPLLLLAIGALFTLILGALTRKQATGFILSIIAAAGAGLWVTTVSAPSLVSHLGLTSSGISHLFTLYFVCMAAAVLLLSIRYTKEHAINGEEYPAAVLFAAFGMVTLISASNFIILFLGLEAMTFAFYFLVAIDREKTISAEAGLKYLLMGVLSAAFLAFGIGLLYCAVGTLDISKTVALTLPQNTPGGLALAGWGCILTGVAFKLSLVPAHLWTPDVYQAAPAPVAAFLSSGSKVAAVLFLIVLLPWAEDLQPLRLPLFCTAILSMLIGNLAALRQNRVRRMLAYSSIAQMGYIIVALLSAKGDGFQAAAYYAIAYGIMSLAAFGAISVFENNGCGENIEDYRGLGFTYPLAGGVLSMALFSLAGIPPSTGFTGKFLIFAAALRAGELTLAIIGIIAAAVSIYFYLRLVTVLYGKKEQEEQQGSRDIFESIVLLVSAFFIIYLGIFPAQLLDFLSSQF